MPVSRSARANSCVAPRSRAREQRTLEVLGGDLLEREREHLEVVGRRVRPGAALAQDARERLAGAVEQSSGWKPKPRFQFGVAPCFSEWLLTRWESKSRTISRGAPPAAQTRSRALARAPRIPSSPPSSAAAATARQAVGAEVAEPKSSVARAARRGPRGSRRHRRGFAQNPPAVVAARALAGIGEGLGEGACQPEAIGQLGDQRGPRAGHQSVSVRGDFYLPETAVLCHPQGDPPGRGLRTSTPRILPAQEDGSSVSGQPPRASAAERSGLGSSP